MDLVALILLIVSAGWFAFGRAWPSALLAAGLACWLLSDLGAITIG